MAAPFLDQDTVAWADHADQAGQEREREQGQGQERDSPQQPGWVSAQLESPCQVERRCRQRPQSQAVQECLKEQ